MLLLELHVRDGNADVVNISTPDLGSLISSDVMNV